LLWRAVDKYTARQKNIADGVSIIIIVIFYFYFFFFSSFLHSENANQDVEVLFFALGAGDAVNERWVLNPGFRGEHLSVGEFVDLCQQSILAFFTKRVKWIHFTADFAGQG